METQLGPLLELYFIMDSTKYHVERPISNKSKQFAREYFAHLPDRMFCQMTRREKRSFFHLVELIESHPVFHNNSRKYQVPFECQLAVTLDRLGHDKNGLCLNHMIPTWGVSNGSLVLFTKRCFPTLEFFFNNKIRWPNSRERESLSDEFARFGYPRCGASGWLPFSFVTTSKRR